MKKNILFWVNAGGMVGLGHYYRSINLAEFLQRKGHSVYFVHEQSLFWDQIKEFPFYHAGLGNNDKELFVLRFMEKKAINVFYVDGLIEFRSSFIERVKQRAKVFFYQNMTSSRFLADVFFFPSVYQDKVFFEGFNAGTKVYKGLEYLLLNNNLEKIKPRLFDKNKKVKRVGILAGGSDPANTLQRMQRLLDLTRLASLNFTYYYGLDYLHFDALSSNEIGTRYVPFRMEDVIENDIVISAFGVTTYELMYLGVPVISFGHQISNSKASYGVAQETNGIFDIGLIDDLTPAILYQAISRMIEDLEMREHLVINAMKSIKLNGAKRITRIIENE